MLAACAATGITYNAHNQQQPTHHNMEKQAINARLQPEEWADISSVQKLCAGSQQAGTGADQVQHCTSSCCAAGKSPPALLPSKHTKQNNRPCGINHWSTVNRPW